MSQISEIKCHTCGEWSRWTGSISDRCPHCGEYFEPRRIQYAEERRITTENNKQNSYLVIHESDDPLVQIFKQFVNWLRWGTYYGISVIYIVIGILVVVYGLAML